MPLRRARPPSPIDNACWRSRDTDASCIDATHKCQNRCVTEPPPPWSGRKKGLVALYACALPLVGLVLGGWWIAVALVGAVSGLFAIRSVP